MTYGYSARLIDLNKYADQKLIGVRLGKACIKANLSVAEVADRIGVSRQTVYNWFSGVSDPQPAYVAAVTELLEALSASS
jgi:transcriptional regulator with XRE-family HTH domain